MNDKLTLFIGVTSAAVFLQMLILLGIFIAIRSLSKHVSAATDEMKAQAMPLMQEARKLQEDAKRLLETSSPKLELVLDNAAAISTTAHSGLDRIENTLNDVLDRARLQIIRADEMVTRAMDSVEETSEKVAHTVTSPVKQASGIMHGISTGFGAYFGQKRVRKSGPSDEMFI